MTAAAQPVPTETKARPRRLVTRERIERIAGERSAAALPVISDDEVVARLKALDQWLGQQSNMSQRGGMRRAEEMLRLLGEYKVLRTRHLQELCWQRPFDGYPAMTKSSAEKLSEATLAAMRGQGLVKQIWLRGQGLGSSAYLLDGAGHSAYVHLLRDAGSLKRQRGRKPSETRLFSEWAQKFNHDLNLSDFMVAMKADLEAIGGSADWVSERRSRQLPGYGPQKGQLQWDALGLSEVLGLTLDFMLELDNNTMELGDMATKVVAYIGHYKKHYKAKTAKWQQATMRSRYPEILVVTTGTEVRMEHLLTHMMTRLHLLGFDGELTMSFTTTSRIAQAIAEGIAQSPLDAPVWATMNWERGKPDGVLEDFFPIIDYQGLLGELEKKMRKLIADIEGADIQAKPRLRERLAEMKAVMEKLMPRATRAQRSAGIGGRQ